MSVYHNIYAEVKLEDEWHILGPWFPRKDGGVEFTSILWGQSMLSHAVDHLNEHSRNQVSSSSELSPELGERLKERFKDSYSGVTIVDFNRTIMKWVKPDRMHKYQGYVYRESIPAFEVGEIDDIEEWYTTSDYIDMSPDEKKHLTYYEWDSPYDDYRYYVEVYKTVNALLKVLESAWQYELGWDYSTLEECANNVRLVIVTD